MVQLSAFTAGHSVLQLAIPVVLAALAEMWPTALPWTNPQLTPSILAAADRATRRGQLGSYLGSCETLVRGVVQQRDATIASMVVTASAAKTAAASAMAVSRGQVEGAMKATAVLKVSLSKSEAEAAKHQAAANAAQAATAAAKASVAAAKAAHAAARAAAPRPGKMLAKPAYLIGTSTLYYRAESVRCVSNPPTLLKQQKRLQALGLSAESLEADIVQSCRRLLLPEKFRKSDEFVSMTPKQRCEPI